MLLSLLSLFLLHQTSSRPISSCKAQKDCFDVEFTRNYEKSKDGLINTVTVCMVYDSKKSRCIKDDDDPISYVCTGQNPFTRTGFGGGRGDNDHTLCETAPCENRKGGPLSAKDRWVEFVYKDGRGCAGAKKDCEFDDPEAPGHCGGHRRTPCCKEPRSKMCLGSVDPPYQHSCRGATAKEPVCDSGNHKGCIHRIYYDCPYKCKPPTLSPPAGAAMVNAAENDDENVFGLKHPSKSKTAGILSVIVIVASIISVIIAISIYGYIMRKRGRIEKKMVRVEPQSPVTPTSTDRMERSNEDEENTESVENEQNEHNVVEIVSIDGGVIQA